MEDEAKTRWCYLPASVTDRGAIEAWLNKKACAGRRFVQGKFFWMAQFVYDPLVKGVVYRLKETKVDAESAKYRRIDGWHCCNSTIGAVFEVWYKETKNYYAFCPDSPTYRKNERKEEIFRYWSEIPFVLCIMLPDSNGAYTHFLYRLADMTKVAIGIFALAMILLQLRNAWNAEEIGWPSILLSSICGKIYVLAGLSYLVLFLTLL